MAEEQPTPNRRSRSPNTKFLTGGTCPISGLSVYPQRQQSQIDHREGLWMKKRTKHILIWAIVTPVAVFVVAFHIYISGLT